MHQLRSAALKNLADALGVTVDFMMGDPQVFAEIPTIDDLVETGVNIPEFREERFRQIADSLDPLALHENGRVLYVNQSMADMLGYRKEELLGYNGIKMAVATQSHPVVQRMINSRCFATHMKSCSSAKTAVFFRQRFWGDPSERTSD